MYFKTADIEGLKLFYREAGEPSKPTIVLLHGFPSSSYQFHDLIPLLADRFHVVAPDYPGMGFSEAPAPTVLRPTFDDVATVIDAFIAQRAPGPLILYLHDIGGPIGMRIAMAHPGRIAGLIFQNFTTSVEGWNPERLKVYERLGGPETPEKLAETEQFATVERGMFLHKKGARQPDALNPDNWAMDAYAFSIEANRVFMSRLFMNLATFPGCRQLTQNLFFLLSVSAILDSMVPNQSGLDTHWLLAQNLVSILRRAGTANPAEHARKVLLRFESACDGDIENPHLGLAQHLLCTLYPLAQDKLVRRLACRFPEHPRKMS